MEELGRPGGSLLDRMMVADQTVYLPDDQLAKVDRVSMAVSLEVRVPMVDHRLVEFSWRLPHHMKIRDGVGKHLLRQVLYRHVPRQLVERPKMGLSVPLTDWLTGPLRDWSEDLLDPGRMRSEGLLDPVPIRRAWDRIQKGRHEDALGLWAVLQFQAWRRRWLP
jgi:asparagine synthase (glutamine-hydrolysing)